MDDFRIFIQQVTQRILPKLDLSDREDVNILLIAGGCAFRAYRQQRQVHGQVPHQSYCEAGHYHRDVLLPTEDTTAGREQQEN